MRALFKELNPWYALFSYFVVSLALLLRALSEGLFESSDTVLHFLIVKGVTNSPGLLLDHWGKPLFTLLAYPFHFFGFFGMALFNGLCAFLSCIAAWFVLPEARKWLYLFPVLLLASPEFFITTVSGSTETLFALLFVSTLAFERQGRSTIAALLCGASFMARPESVVLIAVFLIYYAMHKQWKALLFIGVVPFLYSIVGLLHIGDFLWLINKVPYGDSSAIYGNGSPFHFVKASSRILGAATQYALFIALPVFFFAFVKDRSELKSLRVLAIGLLVSALIWLLHSYLWANGLKGSLGLLRVLASTVPLAVLAVVYALFRISERAGFTARAISLFLMVLGLYDLPQELHLPMHVTRQEALADLAAERLDDIGIEHRRLVALSPLIPFKTGLDAYDGSRFISVYEFDDEHPESILEHGDLFIWDPHYCANEGKLPLAYFEGRSDFVFKERIDPEVDFTVLNGGNMHYRIMEYRSAPLSDNGAFSKARTSGAHSTYYFNGVSRMSNDTILFDEIEFPFGTNGLAWQSTWPQEVEMEFSGKFFPNNEDGLLRLVQETRQGDSIVSYTSKYIQPGHFSEILKPWREQQDSTFRFYLWNPEKEPMSLVDLNVAVH